MGRLRVPRTSQPQQPVGIDWGNPATAALRGTIHFANGGLYDAVRRVAVKRITQYGSGTFPVVTPHGIAIGANGSTGGTENIGVQVYEAGAGMVCAIYIKDGSVTNAVKVPICINNYGTTWTGTGNTTIGMYWVNTAGERQITFFTRRNAGVEVSVTGVPDGLHYIGFALHENIGLQCFMDGKLVGSSAVVAQYTTGAVVTDTYNSQTLTSLGVGSVLLRAAFNQNVRPLHIQELTRNPWQLFQPLARNVFSDVPATGGSHATSGALTGAGSTLSGTAARFRAFATSGALAPTGAEITGTAVHNIPHATSGALAPTGAEIVGAAARASPGFITHDTSGALATIGAEAAGTAARFRAMATSGALATSGAEITGSAARFRAFDTSGVLTNAGATITGSANRYREMGTSGALAPTGATITGTSVRYRTMDTSGALATAGAEITGSAARFRAFGTSGTLATAGAEINGTAARSTPGVGVYPDPSQVLSGVMYGPTGTEYTGTLSIVLDLNTGRLFKILTTKVGLLL